MTMLPAIASNYPIYSSLHASGELARRAAHAQERMHDCVLCGRQCHVDRLKTLRGCACRTGRHAVVHGFGPHHGEEDILRGEHGSGTISFAWCNLRCAFCQNPRISRQGDGVEVDAEALASIMLELQARGCHNINLVSPSHVVAQILAALDIAASRGLRLPLIYNSGGYDSAEGLELLDGVIDIYMPDMKYGDSRTARQYSRVRNYASINRRAVKEMHRQVGDLVVDENGLAIRGLLVRHLVLPGGLANTGQVLKFLAGEISLHTYVNLMDRYYPPPMARRLPPLDRALTAEEYERALAMAERYGLRRLDRSCSRWC